MMVKIERFVFTRCQRGEHDVCMGRRKRPSPAFGIIYICTCECHVNKEIREVIEYSQPYIKALTDDR